MHPPYDPHPTIPELRVIRAEIDRLDLTLVDLTARRAALARRTAPLKTAQGVDFRDHRREAGLVRRAADAEPRPHPDSRESVGGRDG